jgi:hypothetical protein
MMDEGKIEIKEVILSCLEGGLGTFELARGGQQRTVGDMIESMVSELIMDCGHPGVAVVRPRSRRSVEDVTMLTEHMTFYVDTKTHNVGAEFSMPNLTSVERLRRLLADAEKDLVYVMVDYSVEGSMVTVTGYDVLHVWELDPGSLGVGALGKGQLQIKNANAGLSKTDMGRSAWVEALKVMVRSHLERQALKIQRQIADWA